jgi:hypothetical protein
VTAWLGVVSREHVHRGVALGIAQIGHGKRAGLARMAPGDLLAYYSPRDSYPSGAPVQAFTALGRVADDEIYQVDDDGFQPWRRRVDYESEANEVPLLSLRSDLELTRGPNWGYQLRRGIVELTSHDGDLIAAAMRARP